jgi:hypothetical protein
MIQKKRVLSVFINFLNIELLLLLFLSGAVVNAQQSLFTTENYTTASGYDVSNYSAPISSVVILIPTMATASCIYACSILSTCVFAVIKNNLTCNIYSSSAKTSVYASANSSIVNRQTNGYFLIKKITRLTFEEFINSNLIQFQKDYFSHWHLVPPIVLSAAMLSKVQFGAVS